MEGPKHEAAGEIIDNNRVSSPKVRRVGRGLDEPKVGLDPAPVSSSGEREVIERAAQCDSVDADDQRRERRVYIRLAAGRRANPGTPR